MRALLSPGEDGACDGGGAGAAAGAAGPAQGGARRPPAGRQLAAGDEVLLDTEHTPLPSRSESLLIWMGPFRILARTAPNTYRLDSSPTRRLSRRDVQRLRRVK